MAQETKVLNGKGEYVPLPECAICGKQFVLCPACSGWFCGCKGKMADDMGAVGEVLICPACFPQTADAANMLADRVDLWPKAVEEDDRQLAAELAELALLEDIKDL